MLGQVPPSFPEAIHLVSSDSAAGCVKFCGGRPAYIHYTNDQLTVGPCDQDPERHLELRRTWHAEEDWKRLFGLEDVRAAIAGDRPVVLWATRAFSDLLWLWWALDGLGRIAADRQQIFLARPRPEDPLECVGGSTPDEARPALAAATRVLDNELREGAELWMQYASPSPVAFDEARRRGSRVFPELASNAELHGAWFPRLKGGRLHLSDLDEVLLGCVSDSWRSTRDLQIAEAERLTPLVRSTDGFYPIKRLRAWATHVSSDTKN